MANMGAGHWRKKNNYYCVSISRAPFLSSLLVPASLVFVRTVAIHFNTRKLWKWFSEDNQSFLYLIVDFAGIAELTWAVPSG